MLHKQTPERQSQCLTILNKALFLLALTFAFTVQPIHNSTLAQTVGYHFQLDNQLHLHQHLYQMRPQQFPKTVSWDLGKIGTQAWEDKYAIKLPELLHVENSRLAGLVYPCFPAPVIREHFILSSTNQPTILRITYNPNQRAFSGKVELRLKEYTTHRGLQRLQCLAEIRQPGQQTMMLGDGFRLDLQSFQYSLGIRWVIPWR